MQLIYIHGYGSNQESRKFKILQCHFTSFAVSCPVWTPTTDFALWMDNLYNAVEKEQTIVVIGDSTGANFAYQLKEKREKQGLHTILVLLSPLLNYAHRLNKSLVFTENLKDSLHAISAPSSAFLLLGKQDETLDLRVLNPYDCTDSELIYVEDSHRLPLFEQYVEYIAHYITRRALILSK